MLAKPKKYLIIFIYMLCITTTAFAATIALAEEYTGSKNVNISDEGLFLTQPGQETVNINSNFSKWYFADSDVKEIIIGADVSTIYPGSFSKTPHLTKITVLSDNPNYSDINGVLYNKDKTELLAFPNSHFDATSAFKYTLPESVTKIGDYSFSRNTILQEVVLNDGLTAIGEYAFLNSFSLVKINFPATLDVNSVAANAFLGAMPKHIASASAEVLKQMTSVAGSLETLEYLEGVTSLTSENIFLSANVKKIILPASLTNIELQEYKGVGSISPFNILRVFKSLQQIEISNGNQHYATDGTGIWDKETKTLFAVAASPISPIYSISDEVQAIKYGAFTLNKTIKTVRIGHNITTIDNVGIFLDQGEYDILENFIVDSSNKHFAALDGVLFGKDEQGVLNRLIRYPSKKTNIFSGQGTEPGTGKVIVFNNCYIVPRTVRSIDGAAFSGVETVTRYYLPGVGSSLADGLITFSARSVFPSTPWSSMFVKKGSMAQYVEDKEVVGEDGSITYEKTNFVTMLGATRFVPYNNLNEIDDDDPFYVANKDYGVKK